MHSVPNRSSDKDRRTRLEQYGEGTPYTCLPEVDCEYLIGFWYEMGTRTETWSEIAAYSERTGTHLGTWESQTLMAMCREFTGWQSRGSQQSELPEEVPYIEDTEETRSRLSQAQIRTAERSRQRTHEALKDLR